MGIFGPSKEERIAEAIGQLTAWGKSCGDAEKYLSDHFKDAWPELQGELAAAALGADPLARAIEDMPEQEREMLKQLSRNLPRDLPQMAAQLRQTGMSAEQAKELTPLILACRDPEHRMRGSAALRICTPHIDRPDVAAVAVPAAFAMLKEDHGDPFKAGAGVVQAMGPAALPNLIVLHAQEMKGAAALLKELGAAHPQELAAACAVVGSTHGFLPGLKALQLVGAQKEPLPSGHPAAPWVAQALESGTDVRDDAFAAAKAIGPSEAYVAAARGLLEARAETAARLLCAVVPAGVAALAEELPGLDEAATSAALDALKAVKEVGHPAAPAVAAAAQRHAALVAAALTTLAAIGPTADCIPVAESALGAHPAEAAGALCALGGEGVAVLAAHEAAMDDDAFAATLPALRTAGPAAAPLAPGVTLLLKGDHGGDALQTLAAMKFAARPCAPEILAYFREHASLVAASYLADIADPSFLEPVLRYVFAAPQQASHGRLAAAITSFAETTGVSPQTLRAAVVASTFQHKYRGWQYDAGVIDLTESDAAVETICADRTRGANNILHLLMEKADGKETMDSGCTEPWEETVSFKWQRERAATELRSRGDPPFDPAAFTAAGQAAAPSPVQG